MSKYIFEFEDKKVTEYPSVTTILGDMLNKPMLMKWSRDLACNEIQKKIELYEVSDEKVSN